MNRHSNKFITVSVLLLLPALLEARINLFDLWHPGQDTAVTERYAYEVDGSFIAAENTLEVPFALTYTPETRWEVGGRWGARLYNDKAGINDLLLGMKYLFVQEARENPSIIGEGALSLPTGDSRNNLGTGSVDILLHWALQKQIRQFTGYFGLGIRLNSENADKIQQGGVFFYHAGAGYDYRPDLRLYGELKGFNHADTKVNGAALPDSGYQELYLAPGADYTFDGYVFSGALLIGLTPESSDLGFLLSTRFY